MKTHYAYTEDDNGRDWAMCTFDLSCARTSSRRKLIHELIGTHGQLLARIPATFNQNIPPHEINAALTEHING